MVAQTRGGGTADTTASKKLQFKDKLVGSKNTDVLLKKLQGLQKELSDMDQERVDVKSLSTVKKELINVQILMHKDKGVKAFVACCLADILRLSAPDAPYTSDELQDIFQFVFRQLLNGLKGTKSPYYNQYFHLLESLATVKSVVIVCDLPRADEIMSEIFDTLFKLVTNSLPRNTEICMAEILTALIDEAQTLPHGVLETIMNQFKEKNARMDNPAYRLVVEVCNGAVDKLKRYVCQYFTDTIVQHSKDDDFSEIRVVHDLIAKIHHDCPKLLHNVVPQLDEELKVSEIEVRLLATQVLGEMFSDKGGTDLAKQYPQVWDTWRGRSNDRASQVRIAFVEASKGIIATHPELRGKVEEALNIRLMDPDDKVRAITCKLYSQLDYETALHHVSVDQLRTLAGRCLDRKPAVRHEAMNALCRLWSLARPEIEEKDKVAIKQFAWIPEEVLRAANAAKDSRSQVEALYLKYIIPLPTKDEEDSVWTERLLLVLHYIVEEKNKMTLLNLTNLHLTRPSIFERFLEFCEEYNGGTIDGDEAVVKRRLDLAIQHLSGQFPDRAKASEDLHTFAKQNEPRLYKLLKICMDTQADVKALVKARIEFFRRLEQVSTAIVDTMSIFLRKSSSWVVNTSSIPVLLKRLENVPEPEADEGLSEEEHYARSSKLIGNYISKHCPALYKTHVAELTKALTEDGNPRLVEIALQALAAMEWEPADKGSKETKERIVSFAQSGNPRHSKFAVRIVRHLKESKQIVGKLVDAIAKSLPKANEQHLVGHLAALAEIAKYMPDAFEQKSEVIVAFLVQNLLLQPSPGDAMEIDNDENPDEWGEDDYEIPPRTKAKLLAVKICRNRCLVHAKSESALDVAAPVLKMLVTLLANGGSMTETAADDVKVKSRMRLLAATSLLQLSAFPAYMEKILPHFSLIVITIQDPCFQVRMGFLSKLVTYLSQKRADMRFNLVVFLTAHDPEREVRDRAKGYVALSLARSTPEVRLANFEMIFLRLIHTLTHHPDFDFDEVNLKDTAKYIEFYLDIMGTEENIALLYHLAMKCKTVRDLQEEYNDKLYCCSELAQEIIKTRAKIHGWQIPSYPGKVKLPPDIFQKMPNVETAQKVLKKVYLPHEAILWLGQLGKTAGSPNGKARGRGGGVRAGRKRKSPTTRVRGSTTKKPQRKKRRKSYDEDEENDEDGSENESDIDSDDDPRKAESDDESDDGDEDGDDGQDKDNLGRGARGRAKKRAKREAKKQKKEKNGK